MREINNISRVKNILVYCFSLSLLFGTHLIHGQITLDDVLSKAKENSPFTQILSIASQEGQLSLNNMNVSYLPQIQISGQATYQSEVTSIDIPFPNIEIESPDKDQYRIVAEAQQNIYDGGMTQQRKALQKTITDSKLTSIELEWRKVRKSIIQLYFSILELDSKIKVLAYSKENIQSAISSMNAAVENGVKLPSEQKELRAGLILLLQQEIIIKSKRKQLIHQLELLQGAPFDPQENFTTPFINKLSKYNTNGLNYRLFDLQNEMVNLQNKIENSSFQPRLGAFVQYGYGKPGYNFLSNEFNDFYMVGARASWNLSALYNLSRNKQRRILGQQEIGQKREAFDLQNTIQNAFYEEEITKLITLIDTDDELVKLRNEISQTASTQLENGVLNSTEYLHFINEEKTAMELLESHKIQLIKSQYLQAHENEQ